MPLSINRKNKTFYSNEIDSETGESIFRENFIHKQEADRFQEMLEKAGYVIEVLRK